MYPVDEGSLSGQVVLTVDVIQGTIDQGETILVNFTTEDGTAEGMDLSPDSPLFPRRVATLCCPYRWRC